MFIMYNILSTFIIPMKGISKQTSDLLFFFFFKISYLFIKIQGVYAPPVKSNLFCPEPIASDFIGRMNNIILYLTILNSCNNNEFIIMILNITYVHIIMETSSTIFLLDYNLVSASMFYFSLYDILLYNHIVLIYNHRHWIKRLKIK